MAGIRQPLRKRRIAILDRQTLACHLKCCVIAHSQQPPVRAGSSSRREQDRSLADLLHEYSGPLMLDIGFRSVRILLEFVSNQRWVVSYPEQHHAKGLRKKRGTNGRYKRTIRIFKSARNHLIENDAIGDGTAPSYFIECLLHNIPNNLFRPSFSESYSGIMKYLSTTSLKQFKCQNEVQELFGSSRDLWNVDEARRLVQALGQLWEKWPKFA